MSSSVAKPIIKQIKDRQDALDFFEHVSLPKEDEKTQEIIMNFPTVYIHNWQESGDFEVYVGESNDIFKRTRQHYDAASDNSKWQSKLLEKDASLFIIGHEHFNKSLTLDIENRLMHYMMSVDRVKHVHNLSRDIRLISYNCRLHFSSKKAGLYGILLVEKRSRENTRWSRFLQKIS